ncbi:MAG: winged helix-turn-helix domain-containing protein [Spirochaetaceae bacterium]|nr:winged helix-turn-helix domain-containing protein [Spirochaetaceae bacterium]MBQ8353316.1 winged helix-turn-helix domain-containing protein [Spirochaetaceae bacterium]MBR4011232.1 winged helix-turn-helix domain-containing protein [Spirochaetaceae bacterium]
MEQKSINVDFSENGVKLSLVGLDKSEILPKDYSLDDLAEKITKLLNESKNCKRNLEIDLKAGVIKQGGQEIRLLAKEIKILKYFYKHSNEIVSREQLLSEVWTKNNKETTRTLDVHISRLRQKLGEVGDAQQVIQTVRGIGYKFIEP